MPLSGPCAAARADVDSRCAEAERLAAAAVAHQQQLRDVRQQLMEVSAQHEVDARVRDRRQISVGKDAARSTYQTAMSQADSDADQREAARVWLREIDRLNRQVEQAERRSVEVLRRTNELEQALPGVELAADAARIAAEGAHEACLVARRVLAACEERAAGAGVVRSSGSVTAMARARPRDRLERPRAHGVAPIALVLRGDRKTLLGIALRLAEETGVEAGRLQLLLLELREAIAARALENQALRFPDHHPFWSQFTLPDGRLVATNLSSMGYRFDGRAGWVDGHSPKTRELSVAVSSVGLDPRTMHRPDGQEAIDALWQGTTVEVEEFLAARAPDLELQDVMTCLGPHAARLAELWDMWGRLRPLLLTPA